jgi:peptidoglycan biosynthesis protein MviN/MurJ (putative lipid II flippase)
MDYIYAFKFLSVMVAMILADICWTYYFIKVDERKSVLAGIWASLIIVFGMISVINYVEDRTLTIAAIIGSFIGTYIAVETKKRKEYKIKKKESSENPNN